MNPKKFKGGGGHICPKVKTPYGQKRGGGIWRRPGGEPSGARAPPKGRAKRRRLTDSRRTFTPRRRNCAQSKYVRIVGTKKEQQKRCPTAHIAFRARRTPCRTVFCSPLLRTAGRKKAHPLAPLRGGKSPRAAPRFAGGCYKKQARQNSAPE